jgi:hypothetical protein
MRPLIASLAVAVAVLAVAMLWNVRSAAPPPRAPLPPTPTEREPVAMQPLPPPIQAAAAAAVADAAAPDDAALPKAPIDLARPVEPEAREPVAPPPNLDELTQKIEQTPPAERAPLVLQYLEAIHTLPPDEQTRATERLNTALHHH